MSMVVTPRLLAVDDDIACAELVVRVSERCGFEGFATSDSRGVMNLTNALKPIVLSIDICMPNIDADDLIELLAQANFKGHVLIVSGQSPEVLELTAQKARDANLQILGALQKPLDYGQLRNLLRQLEVEHSEAA